MFLNTLSTTLFAMTALLTSCLASNASTIFTANGTFNNGATLSGTLLVDTVSGSLNASSLQVSTVPTLFTNFEAVISPPPGANFFGFKDVTSNPSTQLFLTVLGTSFVNYPGGPLCGTTNNCRLSPGGGGIVYTNLVGTGTPVLLATGTLQPVPEPGTPYLVFVALLCLGFLKTERRARDKVSQNK
jgi:hypothetical protein